MNLKICENNAIKTSIPFFLCLTLFRRKLYMYIRRLEIKRRNKIKEIFFFKGNGNETRRSSIRLARSLSTDSTVRLIFFYFFLLPQSMVACIFFLSAYRPFLSCVCAATAFPVSLRDREPSPSQLPDDDDAPVVQGWRNHGTERVLRNRKN